MLKLADTYASLADWLIRKYNKYVALICMEQLDESLAREVYKRIKHPERVRIFSSRLYNASQMTLLLRGLDLLITSRFHASVLSLESAVPQIAVGHDLRLKTLYTDLGMHKKYFFPADTTDLLTSLQSRSSELITDPQPVKELLASGHAEHLNRARRNREILKNFLDSHGFDHNA